MMSENNNENEVSEVENNEILYAIAETIENGAMMVSASPELWIKGHILYWPPGPADRRNPGPPQEDWIPHMCRILKGSIVTATFEEALELEQRYSKHNDSHSFRKAQAEKQLRRDHPVNENPQLDLIDANSMVNEIDSHVLQENESEANDVVRNKYHKNCHENNSANLRSGTLKKKNIAKVGVKQARPLHKNQLKSKNSNLKQSEVVKDIKKPALPRYMNYLKSGINKFSSKKTVPLQQKNVFPPKKTASASATITKEQYLKQNGMSETENQDPLSPPTLDNPFRVGELSKNYPGLGEVDLGQFDGFANVCVPAREQVQIGTSKCNEGVIKKRKLNILENISIEPTSSSTPMLTGMSFEDRVLRELNGLKKDQQKSDEKRVQFEARMEVKWDVFVKGTSQNQGQSQNNCQDPDLVDENDDFEDLDENFPIKVERYVEELNWSIQRDLTFKRRLKNRLDDLAGNDAKASIRLKMKYLISDPVLDRYSWTGTVETQKKPFKQLVALNNLIFYSVQKQFPAYTKLEYKNYMIYKWLKHTRSRQRIVTYRYPGRNQRNDDFGDVDEEELEAQNEDEEGDDNN